jgi:hypothetical protein
MAGPKSVARRGLGAAAARRREREAERATERLSDGAPAVLVADAVAGPAPPQNRSVALAPDQSAARVRGSAAELP